MIAHQGKSPTCELNSDLMAPTCMQAHMDEGGFSLGQPLEFKSGLFYSFSLPFHHKNLIFPAVFPQKIRPIATFGWRTVNHGHVFLDHGSLLHRPTQGGSRLLRAGIDHDTAHVFIQTMDRKHLPAQFFPQCRRHFLLRVKTNRLDADYYSPIGKKYLHF